MPSKALAQLEVRLVDVEQMLEAHEALTQFNSARTTAKKAAGDLTKLPDVLSALLKSPGPGKPTGVEAINRAGFLLAFAHFQGFVDDLHLELAQIVLRGRAANPTKIAELVKVPRANPHTEVIDKMFAGLGIYDLMDSISWKKCPNATVKARLKKHLEARNKLAHGTALKISKGTVKQTRDFVRILAKKLDASCRTKAKATTGSYPW